MKIKKLHEARKKRKLYLLMLMAKKLSDIETKANLLQNFPQNDSLYIN